MEKLFTGPQEPKMVTRCKEGAFRVLHPSGESRLEAGLKVRSGLHLLATEEQGGDI